MSPDPITGLLTLEELMAGATGGTEVPLAIQTAFASPLEGLGLQTFTEFMGGLGPADLMLPLVPLIAAYVAVGGPGVPVSHLDTQEAEQLAQLGITGEGQLGPGQYVDWSTGFPVLKSTGGFVPTGGLATSRLDLTEGIIAEPEYTLPMASPQTAPMSQPTPSYAIDVAAQPFYTQEPFEYPSAQPTAAPAGFTEPGGAPAAAGTIVTTPTPTNVPSQLEIPAPEPTPAMAGLGGGLTTNLPLNLPGLTGDGTPEGQKQTVTVKVNVGSHNRKDIFRVGG